MDYFCGCGYLGFEIDDTPTLIICLSSRTATLEMLSREFVSRGIAISRRYAGSKAYSSVPASGPVRIAIFATHSREQIDLLINEIRVLVRLVILVPSFASVIRMSVQRKH